MTISYSNGQYVNINVEILSVYKQFGFFWETVNIYNNANITLFI